jgi:hypothetical protein
MPIFGSDARASRPQSMAQQRTIEWRTARKEELASKLMLNGMALLRRA